MPELPKTIIEYFVKHMGTHITYQQLLTAACNRVAGVEMWVQTQHDLGIQTDIPDIIVRLSSAKQYWRYERLGTDWLVSPCTGAVTV